MMGIPGVYATLPTMMGIPWCICHPTYPPWVHHVSHRPTTVHLPGTPSGRPSRARTDSCRTDSCWHASYRLSRYHHPFHCWSVMSVMVRTVGTQGYTGGREACCEES